MVQLMCYFEYRLLHVLRRKKKGESGCSVNDVGKIIIASQQSALTFSVSVSSFVPFQDSAVT